MLHAKYIAGVALLLFSMSISCSATATNHCSPSRAQIADAALDGLSNWAAVQRFQSKYVACDDGGIAEGLSEAIARLLVDKWTDLPKLGDMILKRPSMKEFVVRHIDSTLNTDDLLKIKVKAESACPKTYVELCSDIHRAALRALK